MPCLFIAHGFVVDLVVVISCNAITRTNSHVTRVVPCGLTPCPFRCALLISVAGIVAAGHFQTLLDSGLQSHTFVDFNHTIST